MRWALGIARVPLLLGAGILRVHAFNHCWMQHAVPDPLDLSWPGSVLVYRVPKL